MKKILKNGLSLAMAFLMVVSSAIVPIFAESLTSITEIDISQCEKIYFKCLTDKDTAGYKVGEEMVFTLTLYADGKQISAPYFNYVIKGDDGYSASGYADATSGTVELKAKATKPGAVRIEVLPADANKQVIKGKNITKFEGGAIANPSEISTTYPEPLDFDEFWEGKLAELDECAPDIFSIEQINPSNASTRYDYYIVKVNCIGKPNMTATNATYTAGILSVPKNAEPGTLSLKLVFQGYGVYSAGVSAYSKTVYFAVCAHSIDQLMEDAYYNEEALGLTDYAFSPAENADPNNAYLTYMLLRDVQALRFLKKYFGEEGGEASLNDVKTGEAINTGAWKGLWNGESIETRGSSQGGFQAIGVAALDKDVSYVYAGVPWHADVGVNTIPTRIHSTFRPEYVDGLLYLDTAIFAKRIEAEKVELMGGTGDPLCPMYGVQSVYNNLNVDYASLTFKQGHAHSTTNSVGEDSLQVKTKDSITASTDAFVAVGVDAETFTNSWLALTGRNAVVVESPEDFDDDHDKKIVIDIKAFSDVNDEGKSYEEVYNEIKATAANSGADIYAVGYTGTLAALNNTHKALFTLAADPTSNVYLVSLNEKADNIMSLTRSVVTNLSGAIFENQPLNNVEYKIVSENGLVSGSLVSVNDLNNISIYPVALPCYAMKSAELSTVYNSPEESGTENGSITLVANGEMKNFSIIKASDIDAWGEDAGITWVLSGKTLNVYGKDIAADSSYDWNSYIGAVEKVVLNDGITSIPSNAFSVPAGAKIQIPFSVKSIDDNAFFGNTNFTIVSYEFSTAQNFAKAKGISFESLGVSYVEGHIQGPYADNIWTYNASTKTLTITSNKPSGYNETGSMKDDYTDSWKPFITEIEKVVIEGNISKISGAAFKGATNLKEVIHNGITQIDTGVFYDCPNLTTVSVYGHVALPGVLDFSTVTNKSSNFTKKIFNGNTKAYGIILSSVYGNEAGSIDIMNLPRNLTTIYGSSEYLESFCAENNLKFVCFGKTSDNKMAWTIDDGVMTMMGEGAISGLGTDIANRAAEVTKVVIPDTVTTIKNEAFAELINLESVRFKGNAPKVSGGTKPFGNRGSSFSVIVEMDAKGFGSKTWCGYTIVKYIYKAGDLNGDDVVNAIDAVMLAQYLANWDIEANIKAADTNGDGTVNAIDAVLLAQYLANWDVTLADPQLPDPGDDTELEDIEVESGRLFD